MADVTMYGTQSCQFCLRAEKYLKRKAVGYIDKILVDTQSGTLKEMISRSGRRTVPQIFIGDVHVGGYEDLVNLDRLGQLDDLLAV